MCPILTEKITPVIIAFDEGENICRTLDRLYWARRVVVVDSGSTDGTSKILLRYPHVDQVYRKFDTFADQCNFGLAQVRTKWALSLDADYELSDELIREICSLEEADGVFGYRVSFIYRVHGRPLRGSLYPPRTILYRVEGAHYVNEGHGHKLYRPGRVQPLRGVVYHDDRKPLSRWFASQQRYATIEADHLQTADPSSLSWVDRIRLLACPAPILVFVYALVIKRCILDGWPGWFYALQRMLAETMLALELIDRRLRRYSPSSAEEVPADPVRTGHRD